MVTFKLFLFGAPRLERDGAVVKIPQRKALALLAYLAATGKAHARDSLATLFWPDHSQSEARLALSRRLYELNKCLPPGALALEAETVAWASDLWLDVAEFTATFAAHPTVTQANLPALQAAADLYTADFLTGFTLPDCPEFDDWQAFQSESLHRTLRSALEKLASAHATAGDAEQAGATARRWLALDPLDESAHCALMQIYAQSGQQSAAIRQYERCVEILQDEMGVAPSETTRQLAAAIRQGLIQPIPRPLAEPTVPVPAPVMRRHNLPGQTTPFIGRQDEVADLTGLLAAPEVKLVTILAPGGMGKTRLSIAVAERQLNRFRDGVFFVPLAPLSAPDDIVTTIAEQVSFSFDGSTTPRQQLLDYFRERQTLLVLDNFEHLLDGAELVTDLLRAAPDVKVLASSREKLNLSGETAYLLAGLHFPTWESPEDVLAYDAARLFVASARRARPDFVLQAQDLDDLARICRLTAGMPLAIVLAAGWLDVLSPAQVAAELQQGLDILETEQRDVPERQRSVRATFNYSWERLAEEERQVFMRLAVFRGGLAFDATAAVAGADLRILRRLTAKSLVQALPADRYEVHELLRQYGEEKLRQTEFIESVRQAHSAYYLAFLAARDEDIKGRRQQAGLQEIRADFENIRQAWLWAVEHQQLDAISRAALECLVNFVGMSYTGLDAVALLDQTIAAAADQPSQPLWEQAVVRRGWVRWRINEPIDPVQLRIILARARERGDTREMAYCLTVLALHATQTADYASPAPAEALRLWQAVGDPFYITYALTRAAHARPGDLDTIIESLRQSEQIQRASGNWINVCTSLVFLSDLLVLTGATDEAETLLDEVVKVQHEIGTDRHSVAVLSAKANLAFWRGEFDTAEQLIRLWQESVRRRSYRAANGLYSLNFLALMSWLAGVRGDYQQGYALSQQLAAIPQTRYFLFAWRYNWGLALAQVGVGNLEAARQALYDVLALTHLTFKSPTIRQMCLPLAALLAETPERAVELLALASRAPHAYSGWTAHWPLLIERRRELEAVLGEERFAAVWKRGSSLKLDPVVEQLLAELASD